MKGFCMRTSLIIMIAAMGILSACSVLSGPAKSGKTSSTLSQSDISHPESQDIHDGKFVADVTIPDGSVMKPGEKFKKTWRVRNSGSGTWTHCRIVFTRGDLLNAPQSASLPPASPGEEVDITIPMKAPSAPGLYTGYWNLTDDKGVSFGDSLWIIIQVQDSLKQ